MMQITKIQAPSKVSVRASQPARGVVAKALPRPQDAAPAILAGVASLILTASPAEAAFGADSSTGTKPETPVFNNPKELVEQSAPAFPWGRTKDQGISGLKRSTNDVKNTAVDNITDATSKEGLQRVTGEITQQVKDVVNSKDDRKGLRDPSGLVQTRKAAEREGALKNVNRPKNFENINGGEDKANTPFINPGVGLKEVVDTAIDKSKAGLQEVSNRPRKEAEKEFKQENKANAPDSFTRRPFDSASESMKQ